MPIPRDAVRSPAVLFTLVAFAFAALLTGCRVSIEEPQSAGTNVQRTTAPTVAAPLPRYDVAISAIDFGPPLKRESLLNPQQPVKLVAAVENKGTMQLSRLVVEARVTNQKGDFTAQDQVEVDKLSPGETRIVEFGGPVTLTTLPKSSSFRIRVAVDSAQMDPAAPKPSRELIVRVTDQ
jgi:hypothetical protein